MASDNEISEQTEKHGRTWLSDSKAVFFAMIAEMDLVVKNLINIFFISRFLGAEGSAAYEIVMPCIMVVSGVVALGYVGVQTVCAREYGAGDFDGFDRHKNAGYTWLIVTMAVLTLLFAVFKIPMLDMLGANEGSERFAQLCRDCYSVFLLCFVPQGIFSIACSLLYLEERRRLLVANIILYGCMITGNILVTVTEPTMTGYMTVNVVSAIAADCYLILYCFILHRRSSRASFTAFRLNLTDIKEPFLTGLPDFMEYIFVGVLYLVENLYLLARFSESVVAGVGVFEAIDNLPETICVGFSFLVTAILGLKVGRVIGASTPSDEHKAEEELDLAARKLTRGAVIGSLALAALLLIFARPMVGLFLAGDDPVAVGSAVLLTVSCAIGFIFYMINSELVCYYKIVGAYIPAHIMFFGEALVFPLAFKIILGELFGVDGFCIGACVGEAVTFLLNLCIVWKINRKFPLRLRDFRLDKYLQRQVEQHKEDAKA